MIRKPMVKNKYNLKPKDIQKAVLLKKGALPTPPFWRNNVVHAWCLSGGAGKDCFGDAENTYWIGFYDEDAPAYKGKIRLELTSHGGMCSYNIKQFFNEKDIRSIEDLQIQEQLLERINWLIDERIIEIPRNDKKQP